MTRTVLILLLLIISGHSYLTRIPHRYRHSISKSYLRSKKINGEGKLDEGLLSCLESNRDIMKLREKIHNLQNQTRQIGEEIENARKLLAENSEKFGPQIIRVKSEFERMKARSKEEQKFVTETAIADALKDVLPLWNNYVRAKKALHAETPREAEILHAYDQIFQLLDKEISGFGLTQIETVGKPFDYMTMDAAMQIPSEYPENIVCTELQIGYKIGSRCIRPAIVAVSSGSA